MSGVELSTQERQLCNYLRDLPREKKYRYDDSATNELLYSLFWSLAGGNEDHMCLLFPREHWPDRSRKTQLKAAQGAEEGAEYTEAARGKACGHIFKSGEATYRCKTCTTDDTCVLCSRCYASSDHTDHVIMISISPGNSGCCDCGDPEAWNIPVHCTIHTDHETLGTIGVASKGKGKDVKQSVPVTLQDSIRMTISRVLDFMCDVISCSPEHLRQDKTKASVLRDEQMSRFSSRYYPDGEKDGPIEFAVVLWNDEKHTVWEVRDQVARACKVKIAEGLQRAHETDEIGRSIVQYGTDVDKLLKCASVIEQIKVSVSVRSSRDTFREQMCGTLIEWLSDISGCMVGEDPDILRQIVCEEMLKPWNVGSGASNAAIGKNGIDDHEKSDQENDPDIMFLRRARMIQRQAADAANALRNATQANDGAEDSDESGEWVTQEELEAMGGLEEMDDDSDAMDDVLDVIVVHPRAPEAQRADVVMAELSAQEEDEATIAGFPPPPPPPPPPPQAQFSRDLDRSDTGEQDGSDDTPSHTRARKLNGDIPATPGSKSDRSRGYAPDYWVETPEAFLPSANVPLHENLFERLRLDWFLLFDLRLWKKARIDLRDLYISTVVTIPQFKRVLGLRFAGLYTLLAQLYLIADREPDHSIINMSVQMLTTQSITAEVVEKGNFLTHLFSILFTFLASRQVSAPFEVNPNSILKIETGSVTNRRMYHFFLDLKYLFNSPHVQEKFRNEERYLMQFLDLVKLHQGICPNTRAVGDHVEYETDAWISASLVTREINRLCRHLSDSFTYKPGDDLAPLARAINFTAKVVIINSIGAERERFQGSEVKSEMQFKKVGDYEFDTSESGEHTIVKFNLMKEPVSFHHALHFTLSWLIECGKTMSRQELLYILNFNSETLFQKPRLMGLRNPVKRKLTPNECLLAIFDYPLRVCAWLAHMRAGLWVRNGMSLRHQASTYRSVSQRDVSYNRDIFLMQTAMVVCPPETVLATIIDRYGLEMWMKGIYEQNANVFDHAQQLDVAEDMLHLLIILLCERSLLIPYESESRRHHATIRRDIVHALCFKPLSFTEICTKLPEKFQEQDDCQDILDEMTTFRPPTGVNDAGTFQLKEEYLQELDPYIAHFNKNAREEAENIYRKAASNKSGKALSDVVFEPILPVIDGGLFTEVTSFVNTGIFAQIVYYSILYSLKAKTLTATVAPTKVETFLQVALHLVLVAVACDSTAEGEMNEDSLRSFVHVALTQTARSNFMVEAPQAKSIVALLDLLLSKEEFEPCHAKIKLILKRLRQKRPRTFDLTYARMGASVDRIATASPATLNPDSERERKRKAALERHAKIKAEYQQKQATFLSKQSEEIDWGVDEDDEPMDEDPGSKNMWKFPADNCLFCQEETNDSRAYGTFGMISDSRILRQTVFDDKDFVREVAYVPANLDRNAENLRPFGVSGDNKQQIKKLAANGTEVVEEQTFIGKGYPAESAIPGPVSTGCGHIMHYTCFDAYCQSTHRTQSAQIARHHPERLDKNEFVCPLCKAQNNAFLPIVWKDKEESYPGIIGSSKADYKEWLANEIPEALHSIDYDVGNINSANDNHTVSKAYERLVPPLRTQVEETMKDAWEDILSMQAREQQQQQTADAAANQPQIQVQLANGAAININQTGLAGAFGLVGTPQPLPVANNNDPFHSPQPQPPASDAAAPRESNFVQLLKILGRLILTFEKNGFTNYSEDPESGKSGKRKGGLDMMANMLGMSISAVEIQHRGIDSESCSTYVGKIPELNLTHLRILSETAATAMAFLTQTGKKEGEETLFSVYCRRQRIQMFGQRRGHHTKVDPLFSHDIFCWLVEASLGLATLAELDIMHLARLCYVAEISKVLMLVVRNTPVGRLRSFYDSSKGRTGPAVAFSHALRHIDIWHLLYNSYTEYHYVPETMKQSEFETVEAVEECVKRYALVYLRKLALLLYVRDGVDLNAFFPHNTTELERLTQALRFPSFTEICDEISGADSAKSLPPTDSSSKTQVQNLIDHWLESGTEWDAHRSRKPTEEVALGVSSRISVSHPVIFELVGLPKNYDTLVASAMKSRCPTTRKDVSDPILCLFCGAIFCGQASCCLKVEERVGGIFPSQIGGAQQHMRRCNNPIGLFISIRKCNVFYLHRKSGSWGPAPYTDKYGETDQGLRHGRQLFLNQKRYDALLRNVWLSHGVPSVISRKLETGDPNNGGWETI